MNNNIKFAVFKPMQTFFQNFDIAFALVISRGFRARAYLLVYLPLRNGINAVISWKSFVKPDQPNASAFKSNSLDTLFMAMAFQIRAMFIVDYVNVHNYALNDREIVDFYQACYHCHALPIESVYLTLVGTLLRFGELVHTSAPTVCSRQLYLSNWYRLPIRRLSFS